MLKKSNMKQIPLAIAMTAALMFGGAAQAQTPSAGTGGSANPPAAANTMPTTKEQRDAAKPMAESGNATTAGTGGAANPPAGANAKPKGKMQRDATKAKRKSAKKAGTSGTGGNANPPTDANSMPATK